MFKALRSNGESNTSNSIITGQSLSPDDEDHVCMTESRTAQLLFPKSKMNFEPQLSDDFLLCLISTKMYFVAMSNSLILFFL